MIINETVKLITINRRAGRRPTVSTGCQKSTHDLVLTLKLFTFIVCLEEIIANRTVIPALFPCIR